MGTEQENSEKQNDMKEIIKEKEDDIFDKISEIIEQQEEKKNIFIQYRIINNHGVISGDDTKIDNVQINDLKAEKEKRGQKNILADERQLNNWLEENYESYPMALIIASAVFDCLPKEWVVQAADSLYLLFKRSDEENNKRYGITDILYQFGARICQGKMNTYTGKIEVQVIQLAQKEYRREILKYFWRECPKLHNKIIVWLKDYSVGKRISMSRRANEIIGMLAEWDYYYFLYEMVSMIEHDKKVSTDMMFAQIMVSLNKNDTYHKNVHNLMVEWNKRNSVHYLLTNLFVCAELSDKKDILENAIERYISNILKEMDVHNGNVYIDSIYDFFASGMRAFTFYRILIEKIYNRIYNKASVKEKRNICELFLRLFAVDISLTQFDKGEEAIFIKLCFTDREVSYQICCLWQLIWECRACRQMFYTLMAKYDNSVCLSDSEYKLESFVRKVFGNHCTSEMQRDICNKIHRRAKNERNYVER